MGKGGPTLGSAAGSTGKTRVIWRGRSTGALGSGGAQRSSPFGAVRQACCGQGPSGAASAGGSAWAYQQAAGPHQPRPVRGPAVAQAGVHGAAKPVARAGTGSTLRPPLGRKQPRPQRSSSVRFPGPPGPHASRVVEPHGEAACRAAGPGEEVRLLHAHSRQLLLYDMTHEAQLGTGRRLLPEPHGHEVNSAWRPPLVHLV
jgi:hypothetical protein